MPKTKFVKEVLMCRPLHYQVSYSINPWMKVGSANNKLAQKQWQDLVETYQNLRIKINLVDQQPHLPDMVFSTDQGIIQNSKIFMSNFRFKQRRGEREPYLKWFEDKGYEVKFLSDGAFFEGCGECLFFQDILFVGVGFRANQETCQQLKKALQIEVISLELVNPYFYHLDTALFILNNETVFYYPQAFSSKSQKILKKLVPNLIPFTKNEIYNFSANSVVTDHHVILQKGIPTFKKVLQSLGYKTQEVDLSEFIKSGGGAHCLTSILKEDYLET